MEEQEQQPASCELYRPYIQADKPSFENLPEAEGVRNMEECQSIPEMDDSQLVGAPAVAAGDGEVNVGEDARPVEMQVETEVKVGENSGVKRKRGRPPRVQAKAPPPPPKKKRDEEDVCFICFDGGNLVLCDRRGCPKAYHPACIKRDEAFFRSKAKWNCGWHICSNCEKAAHYMCYTCTFSLCKGCIKEADILCVRGNKGFCTTCMRTVLLVENCGQGNKDMVQVDFDDKSSWEYLFKVYWIYLKTKLSLTLDELTKAKNPGKVSVSIARKGESSDELYDDKGSNSDSSCGELAANTSKRRKTKKQPKFDNKEGSLTAEKSGGERAMSLPKGTEWASKELLEFVAHMKNGDTSVLSQFDVQALLLEYIKRNNLRDPRRKSQIICDSRLGKMFGKARVGHFEMLKLLESHFLIKEDSHADYIIQGGFVDSVASQVEVNGNNDNQLMMGKDKRRKARKKGDTKGPQTNLDEYAAIDVHNINLIYLRRNSMENLIEDTEKFHEKVVGSVVRIRITSNDQKQDMYRLVQVVGTSKVDVPYKIGKKTADVMLEILNLDKKEVISIDGISNQEFSEDECRRLRQSVKCGLVKRFTVGEIQEKAVALRAMKVNDWLETEILRLSHLRDRASEKGHRKELRECVEKLQLLNTPEERQRRIQEIPEVHDDPNMDPTYESEEDAGESDDKKKDDYVGAKGSGFIKKGGGPISPRRGADISKDNESSAMKSLSTPSERKRNTFTTFHPDKEEGTTRVHEGENGSSGFQGRVADGSNSWEKPRDLADASGSAIGAQTDQAVVGSESFSGFPSETSMVPPTGITPYSDNSEIERMWHYQDPSGTNQGPFSMVQLRKWSATGFFPPDLRIWRINEQQDDSILLTNALNGQHHKEPPFLYNSNDASAHSNDNNEFVRSTSSSCWSTPVDVVNSKEGQAGSFSEGWDSLKGNNSWSDQPKMDNSLSPPTLSGKPCEILSQQEKEAHVGERWCSGQSHGNWNSHTATVFPSSSGQSIEKCSNSPGFSGQPARQSWIPPTLNCSSNSWNLDSGFVSKSSETSERDHEVDFSNMPSPTPKPSNVDSKDQAAENKQSVSSNVPLQDSGPSWSTASSLVGGGAQLPDVAGEWGGYSPTPDKPSVEEWDSSPVAESSLKPTEVASDLTTSPTSKGDQLPHCSPSHPPSNTSSWQEIVNVPNEFPLAEESVSDLLAEVDAMESLGGLPSPTSALNCSGELGQVPKNDCFSTVEGLSPTPDPGKSDALSSTGDVQMPSQSTITDEPHGVSHADVLDSQKRSGGHSSTSAEIDREGKPSDVSVNQWEAGSDIQPAAPSTSSWDMPAGEGKPSDVSVNQWEAGSDIQPAAPSTSSWDMPAGEGKPSDVSVNQGEAVSDIQPAAPSTSSWNMPAGDATDAALRTGSETTDTGWGPVQGNANLGWGGPAQIHTNLGWGSNQGMLQGNANMNWGISGGNLGMSVSQLKYSGESFHSPRGRGFPGGGSGFGRGRSSWHRQSSFGGGGGGGSSRPPPRGKIICKFYESGYCKKGASCPYLHP